jgi:MYXO-CTERM domain-containing protein
VVLVNEAAAAASVDVAVASPPAGLTTLTSATSSDGSYWQTASVTAGSLHVTVPPYGVVTLYGTGTPTAAPDGGAGGDGGSAGAHDAGAGADASLPGGDAGAGSNGATPSHSSGCGCRTAGGGPPGLALLGAALFGLGGWLRRRARQA